MMRLEHSLSTLMILTSLAAVACGDGTTDEESSSSSQGDGDGAGGGEAEEEGSGGAAEDMLSPFGAPCSESEQCESGICSVISGTDGDTYSIDPARSIAGDGMCTIACDSNFDCPPSGSGLDEGDYWCNDHSGGATATNPGGRYCIHR